MFYRGTIESVLSSCITAWFGNCTVLDRKTLQRIVKTEKIIGVSLPSITDMYTTRCIRKANSIVDDPTHPSHTLFTLMPSGKRRPAIEPLPPLDVDGSLAYQALCLDIGLGMVSGTQADIDAEPLTKGPPHPGVGNPLRGISLQALANRFTMTITVVNPPEMGKSVRKSTDRWDQGCRGVGKGSALQELARVPRLGTSCACPDEPLHILSQRRPPEPLLCELGRPVDPQVAGAGRLMNPSYNLLVKLTGHVELGRGTVSWWRIVGVGSLNLLLNASPDRG
ncbi:hypothetical protein QTP86_000381 [Hemibagrus guttatus]|nr:hypothetical protein QTP86_000381 [Hemibagrus guttatus]